MVPPVYHAHTYLRMSTAINEHLDVVLPIPRRIELVDGGNCLTIIPSGDMQFLLFLIDVSLT